MLRAGIGAWYVKSGPIRLVGLDGYGVQDIDPCRRELLVQLIHVVEIRTLECKGLRFGLREVMEDAVHIRQPIIESAAIEATNSRVGRIGVCRMVDGGWTRGRGWRIFRVGKAKSIVVVAELVPREGTEK